MKDNTRPDDLLSANSASANSTSVSSLDVNKSKSEQMASNIPWKPKKCIWEITLACNQNCIHCGSNAGVSRKKELTTAEGIELIDSLDLLGCESITLSGGEPLVRKDWKQLAKHIISCNMTMGLITNGIAVEKYADDISKAKFSSVGFSVDGTIEVHDKIRNMPGAANKLLEGAAALVKKKVLIGAVTHINVLNIDLLDQMHDMLVNAGFKGWQLQLTMPHGRAKQGQIILQPSQLPNLEKKLLEIKKRTPMFFQIADNLGYMGKGEPILRSGTKKADKFYSGCYAGLSVIGITSDGSVRGCLSMTDVFNEGNIRKESLSEIWNSPNSFKYNRNFKISDLTEKCTNCSFAKICRGGCKSMAFAVTGGTTHNPHCLHSLTKI